jgi:hypothetical protein
MGALTDVLFRKRARLEIRLIGGVDGIFRLMDVLLEEAAAGAPSGAPAAPMGRVLEIEAEFEQQYDAFLESIDRRHNLPFYWTDLFEVYSGLKGIFSLLIDYCIKRQIFQSRYSFRALLQQESGLLRNARSFLEEHLANREYAAELLESYHLQVKEFSRIHFQNVASLGSGANGTAGDMKILEIFERMNQLNRAVLDRLQKVFAGAGL